MIKSALEFVKLRTSTDPAEYHRAAHEPADETTWLSIINDFPDMKEWVIHNKTIPLKILYLLSDDPDSNIRQAVACKRKIDHYLFDKLANDKCESVRHSIAYNAKVPVKILEKLKNDPCEIVQKAATEKLNS